MQWFLGTPIGLLLLFGWTLSLCFHLCNGIRHLAWDAGFGFEKPQVPPHSGIVVLVAPAVLTVLIWIIGLAIW